MYTDLKHPLIKYYSINLDNINGTCYDGKNNFIAPSQQRHYPDEYLIANILQAYVDSKSEQLHKKVIVLAQPWHAETNTRDGINSIDGASSNSAKFNELILKTINNHINDDVLILAPFLDRGYHHPGIAISTKEQRALFIDPFGKPYKSRSEFFESIYKDQSDGGLGFKVETCDVEQQVRGKDHTNCGPILTASFMELIDSFKKGHKLSQDLFQKARPNLATIRMHQIAINNHANAKYVNEIMLADSRLWQFFLKEQNIDLKTSNEIIAKFSKYQIEIIKNYDNLEFISQVATEQQEIINNILLLNLDSVDIGVGDGESVGVGVGVGKSIQIEKNIESDTSKKVISIDSREEQTPKELINNFFKEHKKLQQNHNMLYRFFIQSHWHQTNKATDVKEILAHAMNDRTTLGYKNRSLKTCIKLGWLTIINGVVELNKKAPKEIKKSYMNLTRDDECSAQKSVNP